MSKHKKNTELLIIAASTLFIVGFAVFGLSNLRGKDPLTLSVVSQDSEYSVGDTISAGVYLSGEDAASATVVEIKLDYDAAVLELVDADTGTLYDNPLLLDWDLESGTFAMSINPGADTDTKTESSLVEFTFEALSASTGSDISVEDSQVYIYKKGVQDPLAPTLTFKINGKEN